ncbi:MAG: restriction endonuclease [Blastocatellia bacterium]
MKGRNKTVEKTVKEDPDWMKLEKIIAEIQQTLAPGAKVTHNDRIIGKSGEPRKIDVSIRENVGINPILIIIDCKKHAEPIGRKEVAGFAEQVDDVGPCIGIMISDYKFGSGAEDVARKENIILKTFTEANHTDWQQVFGSHPMFFMSLGDWTVHEAWMPESRIGGVVSKNLVRLDPGTTLFTGDLKFYPLNQTGSGIGHLFSAYYDKLPRPRPIGRFKIQIPQANPPYYIYFIDKRLISPPYIVVDGTMIFKKYPVTYDMAKGRALKSDTGNVEAIKVITDGYIMSEVRKQEGILYTEEEWKKHELSPNLGEYKVDDNHIYSFEFVAAPPKKQS